MKKKPEKKPLYVTYIYTSKTSLVKYFVSTCDIFSYNTSFTTKFLNIGKFYHSFNIYRRDL